LPETGHSPGVPSRRQHNQINGGIRFREPQFQERFNSLNDGLMTTCTKHTCLRFLIVNAGYDLEGDNPIHQSRNRTAQKGPRAS
jgi:hypothetical protein